LVQQREYNKANEIDDSDTDMSGDADSPTDPIEASTGDDWFDPIYDANGNMTGGPKPGDEVDDTGTEHWYAYDAWGRLTAVWEDDGDGDREIAGETPDDTVIVEYEYDGLNRRIVKLLRNDEDDWERTDYYYNTSWQVVEERFDEIDDDDETGIVATEPKFQYVWSLRYIDTPVLRDENKDPESDDTCDDGDPDERLYYTHDANMNVTALYYHRLTNQTLYTCVNDFVDPKLKQVAEEAARLRGKANRSSTEEKELERLSDLELELTDFRDELLRIAKFWKPNLNDGVQITAAPLWKLFQHRQWQNRLKATWEKLEAHDYDWAHLALSIWPDRVVHASHKDRSYAIAHDLEDKLWHEVEVEKIGRGGRVTTKLEWFPRDLSENELNDIIAEVKAR